MVRRRKSTTTDKPTTKTELSNCFMVLYGKAGVGKTTFAAQFPDPYFLHDPKETGILDLQEYGIVPDTIPTQEVGNYDELIDAINTPETRDAMTLVIDSLTGVQTLCFEEHCERNYGGNWSKDGFYSFYSGPAGAARDEWSKFLNELSIYRKICTHQPNIILIAHSTIETFKNPAGIDYDEYRPNLDKRVWEQTEQVLPCILFYDYKYEVNQDSKLGKAKAARGTTRRILRTEYDPPINAKNRWNLPSFIEMPEDPVQCYTNLSSAILKNKIN